MRCIALTLIVALLFMTGCGTGGAAGTSYAGDTAAVESPPQTRCVAAMDVQMLIAHG